MQQFAGPDQHAYAARDSSAAFSRGLVAQNHFVKPVCSATLPEGSPSLRGRVLCSKHQAVAA